jgi:hypothetical protein
MDIAGLINRLGSTRREYAGSFYAVHPIIRPRMFAASAELVRTDNSIEFEGGVKYDEEHAPLSFRLAIPFSRMHPQGAIAELHCPTIGKIEGDLMSCGSGFSFLAVSGVTAVSFHVAFGSTGPDFETSGVARLYPQSIAFHAKPASQWERSLQAKIYRLPGS